MIFHISEHNHYFLIVYRAKSRTICQCWNYTHKLLDVGCITIIAQLGHEHNAKYLLSTFQFLFLQFVKFVCTNCSMQYFLLFTSQKKLMAPCTTRIAVEAKYPTYIAKAQKRPLTDTLSASRMATRQTQSRGLSISRVFFP